VGVILTPGLTFGAYRILAPLGRGGMGEVYRARDTRLGRDVALKILREDGASDPERVRRFEDEARAASFLNHPNIVVIYEVGETTLPGESRPTRYLAMELVEGSPLSEVLVGSRLPTRRFLDIASQLADGLARAHENGIVHRDLKPSNVVVSPEDHVKILDFGLAKLRTLAEDGISSGPTRDETETAPGTVLGTVGYMSPEQVRGEPAVPASDQFSLGCIFYEMLTGNRPFRAGSSADVMSAILRDDPVPIAESNPNAPDPVCWIVERCLAKSPSRRYVSTRDLARDLQNLRDHVLESKPLVSIEAARPRRRWWRAAAAVAALLLLGTAAILLLKAAWTSRPEPDFRRLTFRRGVVWRALFVPNSNNILYTASWEGLPTKSYLTLPESAGSDRSLDSDVFLPMGFSPDGSDALVLLSRSRAAINSQGTLAWCPTLGGQPRPILQNVGWSDYSGATAQLAVVRDTGPERALELRNGGGQLLRTLFHTVGGISYVRFSPDGRSIAFIHHPSRYDSAGEIRIADVRGAASQALTPTFERCAGLGWSRRTGTIWFTASRANIYSSTLWSVSPTGSLRLIQALPDVFTLQDVSTSGDRCLLIASASGRGMIVRRRDASPRDLTWLGLSMVADVSPDGRSLLFLDGGSTEKTYGTWTRPLEGGDAVRLGTGTPGAFSPDGRWVITMTPQLSGPPQLLLVPVGPGATRQLTSDRAAYAEPSFAGPGTILFGRSEAGTSEIGSMALDGTQGRSLGAAGCDMPSAGPSGSVFLCRCGETKGSLYVFPMEKGPGRKLIDVPEGEMVIYARWNRSGDQIFAVTSDLQRLTIEVSSGRILAAERVDLGEPVAPNALRTAAFNDDASIQAYSFDRFSSGLYLAGGL
jgi:serine/threonine protein kinase/Tol biopolymer transport system component